ncbi:sphingosine-1-phosphate phosphatase 2 isoform X2 [Anabrus simplex]|uniref:sphingosine-1-phosphate phosphatase 2 isoform X2 n=1 Tax=Anabrus simplex TaxID=316456 RepID=UPI0035A269E5
MMWELIEYLKDPLLVARIQEYYGVRIANNYLNPISVPKGNECQNGGLTSTFKNENEDIVLKQRPSSQKSNSPNKSSYAVKSNGSVRKNVEDSETVSSESDSESKGYVITNWMWYYLFIVGTALGDEIFYASFIPFWFWNIDGAVGRRVVLVWAIIMYVGQGIKDIVRWPRPSCPPAVRLQKKWALEYGMPSTHAMVGVAIPFSVILYTMNRYQDIVVGLILALLLMVPLVPIVDALDYYLLTGRWSPFILLLISILLVVFYPSSDRWTPTRGDTTIVLSVSVGVHIGAWINYQLGNMRVSPLTPPYAIIWPSYSMLGLGALRTVIGFCGIIATRAMCKSASYATICALLRLNSKELKQSEDSIENRQKILVELSYKFITYILLGFNTVYLLPNVFRLIGIERPTFYTEI